MSDYLKYLQEKRAEVLKKIKPICEAFGIEDYDYIVSDKGQTEILRIGVKTFFKKFYSDNFGRTENSA